VSLNIIKNHVDYLFIVTKFTYIICILRIIYILRIVLVVNRQVKMFLWTSSQKSVSVATNTAAAIAAAAAQEAKERIDATNRQREESRLQLTKELHRLQVEEKAKGEGAKARVQIVKNKEAKDTKEVTDIALYI
jgi:hypothetical protein